MDNDVGFRPDYPPDLLPLLQREVGLELDWVMGDIGSGPGNLTRRFLDFGAAVFGVEPNTAMREAGEAFLEGAPKFISVAGAAEATTLADASLDLVTAGQAFHWFDPAPTRVEFQRILKSPGWVGLIWNKRPEVEVPVHDARSEMLNPYATEYDVVRHRDTSAEAGMNVLFGSAGYRAFTLPHEQLLNAEAF